MKGLFKFTTAALALLTMASCSNDDLFGNGESAQTPEEGALVVETEDLIDHVSTRAAFVPESNTKNSVYWQSTDFIEVFDDAMVKYDIYQFNRKKGSFLNIDEEGATRVSEPKYALFGGGSIGTPACYINDFGWNYATDETTAEFNLPQNFTVNEVPANGATAFYSFLPMWGEAAQDGDNVKVNMHYLTAVLRVYLKNAHANITNFRVRAYEDQACTKNLPIWGTSVATIADGEGANADAQLEWTSGGGNIVRVNGINNVTGDAYLYIPLFAQKYGALKFDYSTDNGTSWKLIKTTKPMTLKRQTVYRLSLEEFEVSGNSLESINTILEGQKGATADVNIKTQNPTVSVTNDDILKIPAGMTANINLTLKGLNAGTQTNVGIESEDGKYAGTLVVDASAAATPSTLANIYINLPNADVVFIGKFNNTDFGKNTGTGIDNDKLIVKSLTFADPDEITGFGAKNIWVNKESTGSVLVGAGTTVAGKIRLQVGEDAKPGMSDIFIAGTVTGNIEAAQNKVIADVTVNAGGVVGGTITANGDVTIEGTATGNVTSNEGDVTVGDEATASGNISAAKGTVTITSENAITGTITTGELKLGGKANVAAGGTIKKLTLKDQAKVGTVTIAAEGSAEIDVDAQDGKCEAITTSITLSKKSTLTLKQGFINEILNNLTYANADEIPTLKFDDANNYSAIASLKTWNIKIVGASKGNGKAPAVAGYFTKDVWTASQLADVANATGAIRLMNDIDLTNVTAWSMPALSKDFAGIDMKQYTGLGLTESKYPTISNVTIVNKDSKNADANNAGLFSTVADNVEVANFNVKDAKLTLTGEKQNAGILAGSALGIIWVNNVAVEGSIETTAKFNNVGGLIGNAVTPYIGWIKSTNTRDTKDVSVKLDKLQGQYNLGGLIGIVSGTTTKSWINKAKLTDITGGITAVGAKTTIDPTSTGVAEAGAIGLIAGKVDGPLAIENSTVKDVIKGHKAELGFVSNFTASTSTPIKFYGYFGSADNFIGKMASGKSYTKGTTTVTAPAASNHDENTTANPLAALNNYVLYSKYADFDK